jgi:DNA-binding NarL/FixJ family response regulator
MLVADDRRDDRGLRLRGACRPAGTVIVAASESLRRALQGLLDRESDFAVLGTAGTRQEGATLAASLRPDLLIDTLPPGGENVGSWLREVESASPCTRYIFCFLLCRTVGADGRLPTLLAQDFIAALRPFTAAADESAGPQPRDGKPAGRRTLASLTERERQVLRLAAEGLNSSETGRRLGISARTVECHRSHGMRKLGLHRRAELTRFALQAGLIGAADDPSSSA